MARQKERGGQKTHVQTEKALLSCPNCHGNKNKLNPLLEDASVNSISTSDKGSFGGVFRNCPRLIELMKSLCVEDADSVPSVCEGTMFSDQSSHLTNFSEERYGGRNSLELIKKALGRSQTTSSVAELRSALGSLSIRSFQTHGPRQPALTRVNDIIHAHNELIWKLCCQYGNCLHRKLLHFLNGYFDITIGPPGPLVDADFTMLKGSDIVNETALHIAVRWGASIEIIRALMSNMNIDMLRTKNIEGDTFLHLVSHDWLPSQRSDLISLLKIAKERGFQFNATNKRSHTVLSKLLFELIDRATGAVVSGSSKQGPVSYGMRIKAMMDVIHLIKDLSAIDERLIFVSLAHQKTHVRKVLKFLRKCTSEIREPPEDLHCVSQVYEQYFRALQRHDIGVNTPPVHVFHVNLESKASIETFYHPSKDGQSPNDYNRLGQTPAMALIFSVANGSYKEIEAISLLRILIDDGANLAIVDADGNTALHHAAINGLEEIVSLLISAGADRNSRNLLGDTAVDLGTNIFPIRMLGSRPLSSATFLDNMNISGEELLSRWHPSEMNQLLSGLQFSNPLENTDLRNEGIFDQEMDEIILDGKAKSMKKGRKKDGKGDKRKRI